MCGRFTLTRRDGREIAELLGIDPREFRDHLPRYNVAPTQHHYLVTTEYENRRVTLAKWGLVNSWAKDASRAAQQINAKAETIETRGAFKDAFHQRRCVIPADGFYEWEAVGPKEKQPHYFYSPEGLFSLAGVWKQTPEGLAFSIFTTTPNELVGRFHNRMPVILGHNAVAQWLAPDTDKETLTGLMHSFPADLMSGHRVSKAVNSPRNNSASCIEPV